MIKSARRITLIALAVTASALSFGAASASAALPVTYNILAAAPALGKPLAIPPGANDWNCKPSAAHPRPVVLVHGGAVSMGLNWATLSPLLKNEGYCVFALNYGAKDPAKGPYAVAPVTVSAQELSTFVNTVLSKTGAAKVDIVGHSLGGMMPNYYIKFLGGAAKVKKMIGLAPTNHGTDLNGLVTALQKLLQPFPSLYNWVLAAISQQSPSAVDQMPGSDFMKKLNSVPDTVAGLDYTVITTKYDTASTPYKAAFLAAVPGATVNNITIQDKCWLDLADHIALAFDHVTLREVLNALDPANAKKALCTAILPVFGG